MFEIIPALVFGVEITDASDGFPQGFDGARAKPRRFVARWFVILTYGEKWQLIWGLGGCRKSQKIKKPSKKDQRIFTLSI
jgi:hypothetical protein